jgi:hypothetical protein
MLPEKYLSIYALPLTITSGFSKEGGCDEKSKQIVNVPICRIKF